ncbi:MAG: Rne/Rng family ribonuclease [Acidobacteria bacterium]|nr:Rne/Rng family ribonuclease [Acidobacteriota bacterium]
MSDRKMLINAKNPEEIRIATVHGTELENFQIEVSDRGLTKGNIYRGHVHNVEPRLNAAFVDYGVRKNGFLAASGVVRQAWSNEPHGGSRPPPIDEVLGAGAELLVQVRKEPIEEKGARVSTDIELIGRHLVLRPYGTEVHVDRSVTDETKRKDLTALGGKLGVDAGNGVRIRENAIGQTLDTVRRDLRMLQRLWKRIIDESKKGKGPKLLYTDQDIIMRALRDHLTGDIDEVLIDDPLAFARAEKLLRIFIPRGRVKLIHYEERTPLFERFDIETRIDRIHARTVELPSGGMISIDRTEALVAIDVNSGKTSKGLGRDETVLIANTEAANEIARQLRLRDVGGLIVVDFIDMRSQSDRKRVEREIRAAMRPDRARYTVGRISPNGLLEIKRQRLGEALDLQTQRPCPTCGGNGRIASRELVGLGLLRKLENRISTSSIELARVTLHPELADAVQNLRRADLHRLEREFGTRIEVVSSVSAHRSDQEIEWIERKAPAEERRQTDEPAEASVDLPDRRARKRPRPTSNAQAGGRDSARSNTPAT